MPALKWTEEAIRQEALKYQTRGEFRWKAGGAYAAARKKDIVDSVCQHMEEVYRPDGYWTFELCAAEARLFGSTTAWQQGHGASYNAAYKAGWAESCGHHFRKPHKWTPEALHHEALKYTTRVAFKYGNETAYQTAHRRGVMDSICDHMESGRRFDNDTVYIWKAPNEYYQGNPVYKIGITSARLGTKRVYQVNPDAEIIILQPVQGKATDHEAVLHILGDDPQYVTGCGRTEYRALSDSELQEAIQYIEEVAA